MTVRITDLRAHELRIVHAVTDFESVALRKASGEKDVVRLHFGLRGDYSVRYPSLERSYDLVGGHHNILYSSEFDFEFVNKTLSLETFGVNFPVERFVSYVDGTNDRLSRFCERISSGGKGLLFENWANITPAIEQSIREIIDCRYDGAVKDLYLLSKSLELLVLSIEAGEDSPAGQYLKTSTDRDKIVAARDCVNERVTDPPSLSQVAKLVGLNEYKLKRGFKEMFGTTVFAYLTEQRLEIARRTLLDTDKTASEVAFELGYKTPQHFSNAFKKRFGLTPKSMKKNP